jgi:hypothetical protein
MPTQRFYQTSIVLLMLMTGCGRSSSGPHTLAAPSLFNVDVVYDSSVQWDPAQLGRVWVTNPNLFLLKVTLVIHRYLSEENQPIAALSPQHVLNAGEVRREITVGVPLTCGTTYQRDLYLGGPWTKGDTLAELRNFLYAGGGLWTTAPCGQTPPAPPLVPQQPTCADERLTLIKLPYVPPAGLTHELGVVSTFTMGPATVTWGDGSSQAIFSTTHTRHGYPRGLGIVTVTVKTALGCSVSVRNEVEQ